MTFIAKNLAKIGFVIVYWSLIKIAISTDIQEHYLLLSNLDSFQIMFYVA